MNVAETELESEGPCRSGSLHDLDTTSASLHLSDSLVIIPLEEPVQPDNIFIYEESNVTNLQVDGTNDDSATLPEADLNEVDLNANRTENQAPAAPAKRKRQNAPNVKTPPKKRPNNPSKTKATQAKIAYNSGIAHTSLRGKEVKERSMKPGCSAKCRKKCQTLISVERRQCLFNTYYASGSKNSQWHIIGKLVHPNPIKQRKVVSDSPLRKISYAYHLSDENGQLISVCQTMFTATFDISMAIVRTAMMKNSPDKRGKHIENRRRTSPMLIQGVKDHIKSFPLIESHYCREGSRKRYLQANLNVTKMYRMYVPGRTQDTASLRQYRDIFNTCFNIGFYKPKKDQCATCMKWNRLSIEEQPNHPDLMKEYKEHLASKEVVLDIRKKSKSFSRSDENKDGKHKVICFDLQKVFFCPQSEVGDFFYMRKIACYDFTIFDCTLKKAYCYVWDQSIAGRGAVEMSSCVYEYLTREASNGVQEVEIFSDNCSAQNKNKILCTMYSVVSKKLKMNITHRYMEKGHTQMECDSVHACIERKIRKIDGIFTPSMWYGYIQTARIKKPFYTVVRMKQEDFVSFRVLADNNFSWDRVPLSKVRELEFKHLSPGKVVYKRNFSDQGTVQTVFIKKAGRPFNFSTYKPKREYSAPIGLKPKLIKDLKKCLSKGLIPNDALDFYRKVTALDQLQEEGEEEDDVPQEVAQDEGVLENILESDEGKDNGRVWCHISRNMI